MADMFSRLQQTSTFRNDRFARWDGFPIGIIGCGLVGSHLAVEAVRSGANVWLCDFEQVAEHNLGTQVHHPGRSKVASLLELCHAIRPGCADGVESDIRHVGVGVLRKCGALVDCTDDRGLAISLTEISNGLGLPLFRLAVDGSGRTEMGRVLHSDGGRGGACQVCSWTAEDLPRDFVRQPCPGAQTVERPPTLAGGALASTIASLGLLQIQRCVTGNDVELVRNREVIVDWTHMEIISAEVMRSEKCISGHTGWNLREMRGAEIETLSDVFEIAGSLVDGKEFHIAPFGHPISISAGCECGEVVLGAGSQWATRPECPQCQSEMNWNVDTGLNALNESQAKELGAWDLTLSQLGLPEEGALFTVIVDDAPRERLVLA